MRRFVSFVLAVLVATTCVVGEARAQQLFWIDTNFAAPTLTRANADGSGLQSMALEPGTLPEGLAFDATGPQLYWGESAFVNAHVNGVSPALSGAASILSGGSAYRGIAVDAVAGQMYWTSSNLVLGSKIHRAQVDGAGSQVLVELGADANPRGIALDVSGGRMYWADFDRDQILSAKLDGTSVQIEHGLTAQSGPYGVALDLDGGRSYWTEIRTVESCAETSVEAESPRRCRGSRTQPTSRSTYRAA